MPYRVFPLDDFDNQQIIYKENPFAFRLDLPRYCFQDNTGFYTIDVTSTPQEDSCNYCLLDTTVYETVYSGEPDVPSVLSNSSALWLDASDSSTITLVSDAVSEWRDKSGNNRHASQGTSANRPMMSTLNGKDVLSFDGSDDILITTYNIPTVHTIFCIVQQKGQTSGGSLLRPFISTIDAYGIGTVRSDAGQELDFYLSTTRVPRVASSWLNNESIIITSHYNGSFLVGYKNGITYGSLSFSFSLSNSINIGGDTSLPERKFKGIVAEICLFSSILSQANRELVEGYLAWKWGLVGNLPSNHPYKNTYSGITVSVNPVKDIYDFAQAP